ncbi:chromosome segregation protein SMC [Acidicapsa acidisoli]|uniref:chromosome segregation protein SMC n=1 Tax=Acidicapsa acidisoli TaxID=1615681 RepID=UPI0021E00EE5|nr:chromosome segregation protein SMC [Acidicapsa acidisoli]
MLKLKKIHILGFKSFCDRTELALPGTGIAVVVGPNGCGKSNILDGVTWVLGEQSAKTLRGAHMMDVIFAGTRDRKALGMAEVTITMVDPEAYDGPMIVEPEVQVEADLPFDWDEQAVRRQKAAEAEEAVAENQPGQVVDEDEAEETAGPDPAAAAAGTDGAGQPVVLKIRRRKFSRTPQKGEIVITRRLFRTGESEYLLNGKLCRLRDIQDIFMGTGLGPESYAIIGQERIGQLLSSKPHDRRAIIEEAAGITRFKTKKRLAELRLESAKQNLARVDDIFDEVTRQMNSLKRQAAKAERFGALRDELRAKLRVTIASRMAKMDAEQIRLEEEIAKLTAQIDESAAGIETLDSASHELSGRGFELDKLGQAANAQANASAVELERAASRERSNSERVLELESRLEATAAELEQTRTQTVAIAEERTQHKQFLENAAEEARAFRQQVEARQVEARNAAQQVGDAERQVEAGRRNAMHLLSLAGAARNQTSQAEDALAALEREAQRLEGEMEQARAEAANLGAERGQASLRFEGATQGLKQLESEIVEQREALTVQRQQEAVLRQRANQLRGEQAALIGRRNSLDAVIKNHSYSTETVRKLLKPDSLGPGMTPIGTLADFVDVAGEHEVVADDFLREELSYIVVRNWETAEQGIRLLRSGIDGRATFLVHPEENAAAQSHPADPEPEPGLIPLRQTMRVLNGFGNSLESMLPKLRDGYLAPDSETARRLAASHPKGYFLAPTGEWFHNATVSGGKPAVGGPLAVKRELRETQRKLEAVEAELGQAEINTVAATRAIEELAAQLELLNEQRRQAERDAANQGAALKQMESEVQRIERRLQEWILQASRNKDAREQKQGLIGQKLEESQRLEAEHKAAEIRLEELQQGVSELRQSREAFQQEAARVTAELAGLEERRRGADSAFQRIERLHADLERRAQMIEQQRVAAEAERDQRSGENEQLQVRQIELKAARDTAQEEARAAAAEAAALREQLTAAEHQLKTLRGATDGFRENRSRLASLAAKLKSDLEHLEASCLNELNLEASALRAEANAPEAEGGLAYLEGDELTAAEEATREMRQKLEAMGPVNMMALDEYKETAERHAFLETQRKDLVDSIENTQSTIKEIDQISRVKFDEAFARINENFGHVFTKLFHGGQAFLRLTDAENQAESGLEIVASPPGKKLQNVLLLSGGEKALTALSLLVGIFQYQPAPFCVLDEVDAALDETNVGRLADLLHGMSQDTQFLLVTHSKRMMQTADLIYGVTMQEPGVSKIVSVHLGHQQQDRGRERATA